MVVVNAAKLSRRIVLPHADVMHTTQEVYALPQGPFTPPRLPTLDLVCNIIPATPELSTTFLALPSHPLRWKCALLTTIRPAE